MKRIGIAASKMAKGNFALYNLYVVLISCLFSFFIFIVAGISVVFALVLILYVANELLAIEYQKGLMIVGICLGVLTAVVALFNLVAISVNLKLQGSSKEAL